MTKISIVIPAYNRKKEVKLLINSFLEQSIYLHEIIVVDDGSTDLTYEELTSISNPLLRVFRIPNSERGAARNYGARKATGDYINFFDSDDFPYPHHCKTACDISSQSSNPPWFITSSDIGDDSFSNIRPCTPFTYPLIRNLCSGNTVSINCVFLRRDLISAYPFIENRILAGSEDYELWIRLALDFEPVLSPITTSLIINHLDRSVNTLKPEKALRQLLYFCNIISSNSSFDSLPGFRRKILATLYCYLSLQLSISGDYFFQTCFFVFKALCHDISPVTLYKVMVVIKKSLLPSSRII